MALRARMWYIICIFAVRYVHNGGTQDRKQLKQKEIDEFTMWNSGSAQRGQVNPLQLPQQR